MTRSHHRQGSGSDRLKELRRFDSLKDPRTVLTELRYNKISRETAIRRLELTDAFGLFSCGELLVQEAYDKSDTGDPLNTLLTAADYFKAAINSRRLANNERTDFISSRAELQLIHIPIHDLVIQKKFPEADLAEKVHQKTIEIGHNLLIDSWDQYENRIETAGILGEISVLALDQRLSLRKIGCGIYFPCPSTFNQDYHNNHGTVLDGGWDVSVFSDVGNGMHREAKMQVKTRQNTYDGSRIRAVQDDISLIIIDPDLRLPNDYGSIHRGIIEDMVLERDWPEDSGQHIYASIG